MDCMQEHCVYDEIVLGTHQVVGALAENPATGMGKNIFKLQG